ncbi:MAG: type I-U CRISPR-associated helicase/endonuclease Cas3, partial [Frankia sp.]|nr:type I-U CRISPR-associated helicase/endonuclease Cas3 [Frankia sp.]
MSQQTPGASPGAHQVADDNTLPPLALDDWPAFFAAVHGEDRRPFRWQTRLLETLLADGRWPGQIAAPTGAGKTAVIDVHTFAVALTTSAATGPRLPRRLALVVDRRALVDDQFEHASRLARLLADALRVPRQRAGGGPVSAATQPGQALVAVAAALRRLRWQQALDADEQGSPLLVARLRGGLPPPLGWRDDPVAAAVLCATPDMWGSRLLLRGYGSARAARPREAGLLARDAVVVVDEAHLARQLVRTARRVAELQELTEPDLGVPALQVVETTATPDPGAGAVVGVHQDDLTADPPLRDRLTRPKPVRILTLPAWPSGQPGKQRDAAIAELAAEVVRLRAEVTGGTVGCFVNTVSAALAVSEALRSSSDLTVETLVGRMRPMDVIRLRARRDGLLDSRGNADVDVLVATQTLEVGVDIDLAAAVSELAPGTALAQRAGRVNRLGLRPDAPFVVVVGGDPQTRKEKERPLGPYAATDLVAALDWVKARALDADGLAPWALRWDGGAPPPPQTQRRLLTQRLEP